MDTLNFLRTKYGKSAKIIQAIRHGHKTTRGHISAGCLTSIISDGLPRLDPAINVIHHGSSFARTDETTAAATIWILKNSGKIDKHLPKNHTFGNPEIFSTLITPVVKTRIINGENNFEAIYNGNRKELKTWEKELKTTIEELFHSLDAGDNCLLPIHSPTVEALYNLFASRGKKDIKIRMEELEGIFLIQLKGKIIAYK